MNNSEMLSRLEAVEKRVDEHIHDGIQVWKSIEEVKTDLNWIKRGLWCVVGMMITYGIQSFFR